MAHLRTEVVRVGEANKLKFSDRTEDERSFIAHITTREALTARDSSNAAPCEIVEVDEPVSAVSQNKTSRVSNIGRIGATALKWFSRMRRDGCSAATNKIAKGAAISEGTALLATTGSRASPGLATSIAWAESPRARLRSVNRTPICGLGAVRRG